MERARAPWSSSIFLLVTGVLLFTKMLKETEETVSFVVIIFIIGGISLRMAYH